ncbi:hypothetical protein FJ364_00475 [Candidatus Dependentiae bacterium]|nr:hypothetical protein [Candidatus Dependentiae bacterium]
MFKRLTIVGILRVMVCITPVSVFSQEGRQVEHAHVDDNQSSNEELQQDLLNSLINKVDEKDQNTPGIQHLFRLLQAGAMREQKMREALSPALRSRIDAVMVHYSDFVARVHIPHAIYKVGSTVLLELGKAQDGESENIAALRSLLNESLEALRQGSWGVMFDTLNKNYKNEVRELLGDFFAGTITGSSGVNSGLPGMTRPSQEDDRVTYTTDDLSQLALALAVAEADFKKKQSVIQEDQKTLFDLFKRYLDALLKEDLHELSRVSFDYLEPEYLALTKELFGLQEELWALFEQSTARALSAAPTEREAYVAHVIEKMDVSLNDMHQQMLYADNPYYYWLIQLKQKEGSCTAYSFIKRRFKKEGIKKDFFQFFKLFAHAYSFATNFLDIYQEEAQDHEIEWYDKRRVMPTLFNYALTSTVAANYFFNVQDVARNSMYYEALLTKGSVSDERSLLKAFVIDYIGMAAAAPTLLGKPLWGLTMKTRFRKKFERFAASWGYYYVFYNGLFNRNAFFSAEGKSDRGEVALWPAEFSVFRSAMFDIIDEGVDFISLVAESSCYNLFDPEKIADLDDMTLGLVNPGALRYVVKAFLPMLLLSPIGSLLRGSNMLEVDWEGAVGDEYNLIDPVKVIANEALSDNNKKKKKYSPAQIYAATQGFSPAAFYAEKTLVLYACGALGYNTGFMIGDYFHDNVLSGAEKALRGVCKFFDTVGIGMGDAEVTMNTLQFSATLVTTQIIAQAADLIKMLLWPTPEMEQAFEPFIRGFLLDSGYLKINHDKRAYREALLNMLLSRIARLGFISHYDAAVYVKEFKQHPTVETIDVICEKVLEDAKYNAVSMCTGLVGQQVAGIVGKQLYNHYGPIIPKVSRLLSNKASC